MSDDCAKVPSFIPGHVTDKLGPSICNDGAKYLFAPSEPFPGPSLRVKPTNGQADEDLEAALKSGQEVVIAVYRCVGPGSCVRYECYHVSEADSARAGMSSYLEASSGPLAGTSWRLTEFLSGNSETPPIPGTELTAMFHQGAVSGSGGCNIYSASYLIKLPEAITIHNLISTLRFCEEPKGVMEQESKYYETLTGADRFLMEKGELVLTSTETGQGLRFVSIDCEPK